MRTKHSNQDNERWRVLSSPERTMPVASRLNHTFIYGVKTTGVFCLPGCSSRLPKRENVLFFDNCAEAKEAGFRACKRCEPEKTIDSTTKTIKLACHLIDESNGSITLKELAQAAGLSTFHLLRQFKKHVGTTPKQYALGKRRSHLQSALTTTESVMDAIYEAGYNSPGRAYDSGSKLGLRPSEYRRGASGASIQYAIEKCSLGLVLVAATDRGICCIELGDSVRQLKESLRKRFPSATIADADKPLARHISGVVALIENPSAFPSTLPLDIQGTAFQIRVWNELQKVPAGSTTTYSEIARRLEQPDAARAVARAIASNKLAVAIPCHRVIRKGGEISGYRWGVDRKRRLLERENGAES